MAGGKGSRMNYRNKAMLDLFGKPMIWYTINALRDANIDSIVCAIRDKETAIYLTREDVNILQTEGKGYSIDLRYALEAIKDVTLITPVDMPLLNAKLLNYIIGKSKMYKKECVSVMVKKMLLDTFKIDNKFCKIYNEEEVCYTGISVIDASRMSDNMEEDMMIIDDYRLAMNINSEYELKLVSTLFKDYLIASQSLRES